MRFSRIFASLRPKKRVAARRAKIYIMKSQTFSGSQSFAQLLLQKSKKSVDNHPHKVHLKAVMSKKPTKTPYQLYWGESAYLSHLTRVNSIFWLSDFDIRILRSRLHLFMMFWGKIFFSYFYPISRTTIRKWESRYFRLVYLDQFSWFGLSLHRVH